MENRKEDIFIKEISIENFKSIKKIDFKAKRINLFIGKPNVGKSNILEAFVFHAVSGNYEGCNINDLIRFNEINDLFHFKNHKENIKVVIDNNELFGNKKSSNVFKYDIINKNNVNEFPLDQLQLDGLLINLKKTQFSNEIAKNSALNNIKHSQVIKFYKFKEFVKLENSQNEVLIAPFGYNLLSVINNELNLKKLFTKYFLEYNLTLIINSDNGEIKLLRIIDGVYDEIPYELIADTLKRMIFYVTAIESNTNSIILLEEPEANCYPTYVADLARRVVNKEDNQFFIATHSPIFIHEILDEDKKNDTAIHIVYYEEDQTKIKTLSDEELNDIESYGYDLFFNEKHFLNDIVES